MGDQHTQVQLFLFLDLHHLFLRLSYRVFEVIVFISLVKLLQLLLFVMCSYVKSFILIEIIKIIF